MAAPITNATNALAAFSAWEKSFDPRDLAKAMIEYGDVPFYCVGLYVFMVFCGQRWMENRKPFNLKPLFTIWNLFLAVFSIRGAALVVPYAIQALQVHGVHGSICKNSLEWWNVGPIGAWMGLFGLSKIPELLDTAFLVFQKKPIIFLHWYHHTTVMMYCWFAYLFFSTNGFWFGTMNFVVHAIMYSYYLLTSMSSTRWIARPFAKLITLLQITQMVAGLAIVVVGEYFLRSDPRGCEGVKPAVNRAALVMYGSYFVLFAKFFVDSYLRGGNKRKRQVSDALEAATSSKKIQ